MADPRIKDHGDEMEDDLHTLEGHIDDAKKKLEGSKVAAGNRDEPAADDTGDDDDPVAGEAAGPT